MSMAMYAYIFMKTPSNIEENIIQRTGVIEVKYNVINLVPRRFVG